MNLFDNHITTYESIFFEWLVVTLLCYIISPILGAIKDISVHKPKSFVFYGKFNDKIQKWFFSSFGEGKYIRGNPVLGRKRFKLLKRNFKVPVQLTDAFHFFKMLQIIVYMFPPAYIISYLFENQIIMTLIIWFLLGSIRNKVFSLFYHKIFIINN